MSFQAEVGTYLAALMLTRGTVGQRIGLNHGERIAGLRFESGKGVDDVIVTLTGGGKASLQCKTTLSLSDGEKSDFSKTMAQFVEELVAAPALDPATNALVIAVPTGKSASLDPLAASCARVAAGGLADLASGSQAEKDAFAKLRTCVDRAYSAQAPGAVADYRRLAGLLRVVRFERGASGAMRIDGAVAIGRALYGGEAAGGTPFTVSIDIVREHIKSGHPVDANQFLAELRRRGQVDVARPVMMATSRRSRPTRRRSASGLPGSACCRSPTTNWRGAASPLCSTPPAQGRFSSLANPELARRVRWASSPDNGKRAAQSSSSESINLPASCEPATSRTNCGSNMISSRCWRHGRASVRACS